MDRLNITGTNPVQEPGRILLPLGATYEFVAHKKKTGKNGPWSLPHSQGRAPPRAVARRYRFGCSRRGWLHPNTRTRWTLHRLEEMMKMMMVPAAPPLLLLPLRPLISNRPAGEEWGRIPAIEHGGSLAGWTGGSCGW